MENKEKRKRRKREGGERNGRNKKEKFQESSRAVIRSSQLKMQPNSSRPTSGTTRFEYPTELRQPHGPLSQAKRGGNFSGITQDVKGLAIEFILRQVHTGLSRIENMNSRAFEISLCE